MIAVALQDKLDLNGVTYHIIKKSLNVYSDFVDIMFSQVMSSRCVPQVAG